MTQQPDGNKGYVDNFEIRHKEAPRRKQVWGGKTGMVQGKPDTIYPYPPEHPFPSPEPPTFHPKAGVAYGLRTSEGVRRMDGWWTTTTNPSQTNSSKPKNNFSLFLVRALDRVSMARSARTIRMCVGAIHHFSNFKTNCFFF